MAGKLRPSDHDLSPDRGFLCAHNAADVTLPGELHPAEEAPKTCCGNKQKGRSIAAPALHPASLMQLSRRCAA